MVNFYVRRKLLFLRLQLLNMETLLPSAVSMPSVKFPGSDTILLSLRNFAQLVGFVLYVMHQEEITPPMFSVTLQSN